MTDELYSRRLQANRKIIKELQKAVEYFPSQRFMQLLYNLEAYKLGQDPYYEESEITLETLRGNINELLSR